MLNTATYRALLNAATPSPRSRAVAQAAYTDLIAAGDRGRRDLGLPSHTLTDRRRLWRRAGVVPSDASELAALIRDLRVGSERPSLLGSSEAIARLLWVVLADRQATLGKVEARHAGLIADALEMLDDNGQAKGGARGQGGGSRVR